ncbi:MAG: STM4013/SEN3800 family hydrolase [Myxococcota bacterium]
MRDRVGHVDVLWITLDTLRYDVAQDAWSAGETPVLARLLPPAGWEARHTPGNFTLAAHHAFFSGFWPTPQGPPPHPRTYACRFQGSTTITNETAVFDAANVVQGFADRGYHTVCIGGVGFFNLLTPLGEQLPGYFAERHWSEKLGVTCLDSTAHQVTCALEVLSRTPGRILLFVNISALHQPNCGYLPGATEDSPATMRAALRYVDGALAPLFDAFRGRRQTAVIICGDHGTAYGEDGYFGHRHNHPTVTTVPFMEGWLAA